MMKICSECQRCFDDTVEDCTEMHGLLSDSRPGSVSMIAGYLVEQRLFAGLRGETFRAIRTDCGRSCLIHIVSADSETGSLFLEEARRTAELFHPNLAAVYESGTCDSGELYVVTEDPEDSETLRARLEASSLPDLLESIRIVRVAAETLHELHRADVIHRAVCPENILISADYSGEIHLRFQNIDLGGAGQRSIISNKFLIDTETAAIRYFAPEQCSGEPATARSDVYSLGILLYELIAGAPPFDADRASGVIEQHRSSRPPDIKIDNFDLRMLITHTLMESLGKRADSRQATADLFARQLRHIELLATHVSTPPPAVTVVSASPVFRPPQPVAKREVPRMISMVEPDLDIPAFQDRAAEIEPAVRFPVEPAIIADVVVEEKIDPVPQAATLLPTSGREDLIHRMSRLTRLKARHRQLRILPEPSEAKAETQRADIDLAKIKKIDFDALREQVPVAMTAAASSGESGHLREPKIVHWDEPLDDIPSIEEILEVLHSEGDLAAVFDVAVEGVVEKPPQALPAVRTLEVGDRLIAPVADRATSFALIGLNLDSPVLTERQRDPADPRTVRFADADEIFSSVQSLSAVRFSRLRRGIGVGAIAGLVVLIFMFRGDIVEAFTPFDLGKLHPSQSRLDPGAVPVAIHTKPDTIYSSAQNVPEPVADSAAVNDAPTAVRINGPEFKRAEKPTAREEIQPVTPRRSGQAPKAQDKPAPIQPSTLVITYADPKKKSSDRAKDRDPFVAPKRGPALTRPRIVANPNP